MNEKGHRQEWLLPALVLVLTGFVTAHRLDAGGLDVKAGEAAAGRPTLDLDLPARTERATFALG